MNRLIITAGVDASLVEAISGRGNYVLTVATTCAAVVDAIDAAETHELICELSIGLFGVGRGAHAVLAAAAERPWGVGAVVAMAELLEPSLLERLRAPALLLVPGQLRPLCQLVHEHAEQADPKDLGETVGLVRGWFERHVGAAQREPWSPGANWYAAGELLEPSTP